MSEAQFVVAVVFLCVWGSVMITVLLRDNARIRRQSAALRAAAAADQSVGGSRTSAQTGR